MYTYTHMPKHTYIFSCLFSFSHLYKFVAAQPLLVTVVDVAVTVLFGGHIQLCLRITPSAVLGGTYWVLDIKLVLAMCKASAHALGSELWLQPCDCYCCCYVTGDCTVP